MDKKNQKINFKLFEEYKLENQIKQDLEQLKLDLLVGGIYNIKYHFVFDIDDEFVSKQIDIDGINNKKSFTFQFEYFNKVVNDIDDSGQKTLTLDETELLDSICTYFENDGNEKWTTSDEELMEDMFNFLIKNETEINKINKINNKK